MAKLGNIRSTISRNADALKEGGAAALGTLILGGSKAEAVMTGLGQTILSKVVGPLGKFVGLSYMATKSLYGMTKAWATMGTGAASNLEKVQNQLRVILKGLDAAKARVRELRNFAVATPFKMRDIVQGNRTLESLSRGALSSKEAMRMVGDAAAQAGVDFETMSVYVGRLYDGLEGGRPVGEVLFRLAELGVISGRARTALEQLQESGAGFSQVWRVVEGELKRASGTMGYTSQALEGLQSTLEDTQEELQATFSANFLEGQKEALAAQIRAMENLKPAVEGVGNAYGRVVSVASTWTSKLLEMATSQRWVVAGLELMSRALGVALVGILAVAGATGLTKLTAWLVKTGLAVRILTGSMRLLGVAMGAALGPVGAFVTLLVAAVAWWSKNADETRRAAEAVKEYEGATDALISRMEAQKAAIKTVDQLAAAYQETLSGLADAYRELAAAEAEMNMAEAAGDYQAAGRAAARAGAALRRVTARQTGVAGLDQIDRGGLERDAFFMANRGAMLDGQRAVERAEMEAARSRMTPMSRAASMEKEAEMLAKRRGSAIMENNAIERFRVDRMGIGEALKKNQTAQAAALGRGDAAEVAQLKREEDALRIAELRLAEASGSTVVAMQAKLELMSRYEAAAQGVRDAQVKLREAESVEDEQERAKATEAATQALAEQTKEVERLEASYRSMGLDPAKAQEMRDALERRKREIGTDITNRPEEIALRSQIEQEKRARARAGLESRVDLAQQLMLEDEGALAAAQAQIDAERQRLEMAREYNEIDTEVYNRRKAGLDSEERMLERRRRLAQEENAAGMAAGGLNLRAQAARLSGRGDVARRLEEEAIRAEEEGGRQRRVRELMDQTGLGEMDAAAQIDTEIQRARQGRALEAEGGLLQALLGRGQVVDSLQRVGGGGGQGGGPNIKDVVDRLDKLIKAVQEGREIDIRL